MEAGIGALPWDELEFEVTVDLPGEGSKVFECEGTGIRAVLLSWLNRTDAEHRSEASLEADLRRWIAELCMNGATV